MQAIIRFQGRNHIVHEGQHLQVDRLPEDEGKTVPLTDVLMVIDGEATHFGGKAEATVVKHMRGDKVRVATYKRRKRERKVRGFRADLTELQITSIGKA